MKRVALIVLFLTLTSFVRAEELETILQDEESLSGTGRSAFVKIDITDGDVVEAIINNLAPGQPFSIVGDVISLVTQEDEHNYLDFTPYNKWLASPFTWLMPGQFKISKPYVPFTTPQRGSAHYGAVLSISGFDIVTVVSPECYTTNDNPPELSQGLPDRPPFYEKAQSFGAIWSGAKLVTKDGRVVFDWPSFPVKKINQEDCGRDDPYEDVKPKVSDMVVRAQFSKGEIVSRVIDTIIDEIIDLASGAVEYVYRKLNVHLTAEVTQKLKTDGNAIFPLFDYGANGRETADVITNQTRTKHDGMVSSFVPYKLRKNPIGFAGTDNVIKLTGSYANDGKDYVSREVGANRAYQNGRQAACPVYSYQILKGKGPVKEAFKIGGVVPTDCSPSPSPTPPTGGWNCNTNVGEQSIGGLNKESGQTYADNAYEGCSDNKENAWAMCNNDVIARAKKACVDPIFALTIWLHESAASSYKCGEQRYSSAIEDFGIHTASSVHPENFSEQADYFLKTQIDSTLGHGCPKTMQDFVSIYYLGNACYNQETVENKKIIDDYIGELQYIYGDVLGGGTLPTWPKSDSCSQ